MKTTKKIDIIIPAYKAQNTIDKTVASIVIQNISNECIVTIVNDGDSDLRFTNNFDHAVYIQCYRSGSSVNATIYGSSQDKVGVSIQVDNFTYNGLPAAKTYRTITKNGKSKKSYIYTSVYKE